MLLTNPKGRPIRTNLKSGPITPKPLEVLKENYENFNEIENGIVPFCDQLENHRHNWKYGSIPGPQNPKKKKLQIYSNTDSMQCRYCSICHLVNNINTNSVVSNAKKRHSFRNSLHIAMGEISTKIGDNTITQIEDPRPKTTTIHDGSSNVRRL